MAVSLIVTTAFKLPVAAGAKCPWMVHVAPGAKLDPQLFAMTNEEGFAPPTTMLLMPSVDVPVLVRVALCDPVEEPTVSGPNERVAGKSVTVVGVTPVPLSAMVCGEFAGPSVSVTEAVRVP